VYLDYDGFVADRQGDPRHHGGPEKAVHHYASEHYAFWRRELMPFPDVRNMAVGGFGENISTLGLTEENVCVGDVFQLGGATIQVTQPRQPCWKLAIRFNVEAMALKVQDSGRTGWYYRVLEPGEVGPHDALRRVRQINPQWPLARVLALLYRDVMNTGDLAVLARLPGLTERMRALAAARLARRGVEDWASRLDGH
jgi:MOSC domain-containing protein YiiM